MKRRLPPSANHLSVKFCVLLYLLHPSCLHLCVVAAELVEDLDAPDCSSSNDDCDIGETTKNPSISADASDDTAVHGDGLPKVMELQVSSNRDFVPLEQHHRHGPWSTNARLAAFQLDKRRLARMCHSDSDDQADCASIYSDDPFPGHPRPGTILQVYSTNNKISSVHSKHQDDSQEGDRIGGQSDLNKDAQLHDLEYGTDYLPDNNKPNNERRGYNIPVDQLTNQYRAISIKGDIDWASALFDTAYELIEPLHLDLGTVPRHAYDYAYTPVVVSSMVAEEYLSEFEYRYPKNKQNDAASSLVSPSKPSQSTSDPDEFQSQVIVKEHDDYDTTCHSSSWWQWWFPFTETWWKSNQKSEYHTDDSAFAGGSHGEVWRGQRACPRQKRDSANDSDGHPCGEKSTLILKRLKVEQGYRLLEAGLREVYFGTYLGREAPDGQFTSYVDHFFREVPRRIFGRRRPAYGLGETDLELWIVFEDAGPSLRSYLYSPVHADGGFVVFQHSPLWTKLRLSSTENGKSKDRQNNPRHSEVGKTLMQQVLKQIISAAAFLHSHGIVHRDIKPANVMCKSDQELKTLDDLSNFYPHLVCVLGDFSSGWNNFTDESLYTNGPSPAEQTDEYAPPESFLGSDWVPFHKAKPQSYDSWSIGVLALELLLGTPNVFSVDQRTRALLTAKMKKKGATEEDIQKAMYLAALSNFCIFTPSFAEQPGHQKEPSWPLRRGDPLHNASMVRESCSLQDFHRSLRARDPLGIGFDSSADLLLHLIWQLLAWDPMDRITAEDALKHPFFLSDEENTETLADLIPGWHNAIESQMLDPRLDFNVNDTVHDFKCPKCGRRFDDWSSCQVHARSRRHAKFCEYDKSTLPTCINTHSMLPTHPTSGYCDLQGRRRTIEDFHTIHLDDKLQFYGIFDGHSGNLASKFVASTLYNQLQSSLSIVRDQQIVYTQKNWKENVTQEMIEVFEEIHAKFLHAVSMQNRSKNQPFMDQSGTTATALLMTEQVLVVASLGDSRAILSSTDKSGVSSTIQLTKDHVVSDRDEKVAVEARGGFIVEASKSRIARVNGTLAITRSIGDLDLAQYLSREPMVVAMTIDEVKAQCGHGNSEVPCFVILASDGLWDVVSNQEASEMVTEIIADSMQKTISDEISTDWKSGTVFQEAAEALAVEAYIRGSADNIGVCVVAVA